MTQLGLNQVQNCYSVDAGIMITLENYFPQDLFKPVWDEIAKLTSQGRWKIFSVVAQEVKSTNVQHWLDANNSAVVHWSDTINGYMNRLMAELQANHMMLVNPNSTRNNGDPFVVMLALYFEERDLSDLKKKTCSKTCCVLTTEKFNPKKTNIPSVCQYYGISYMDLYNFMRHHGWEISVSVKNP
jgi:hypothetical protein